MEARDFYYNNPLRRHGDELPRVIRTQDPPLRSPVLPCYCCPTNIARTIAGLKNCAYSKTEDSLWLNLYGSSRVDTAVSGGRLVLGENTDHPWDGMVTLAVEKAPPGEVSLMLRVPGWAEGATLRDGLGPARKTATGEYASLRRVWHAGDTVDCACRCGRGWWPLIHTWNPHATRRRSCAGR